jgi:acetoin utilization protein AcuB
VGRPWDTWGATIPRHGGNAAKSRGQDLAPAMHRTRPANAHAEGAPRFGGGVCSMTARDLMTSNPATVTPQTTIAEAWDSMGELDVRHLPVVDGEALVGMLSDRDLGAVDVIRLLTEQGADALRRQLTRPVIQFMSTDVVTVEPETEVSELVTLLLEQKVGAIPVITPDTRQIVGIVSYVDVLRVMQKVLEAE